MKLSVPFFMVVPGMICRHLYREELTERGSDAAYPLLASKILPPGGEYDSNASTCPLSLRLLQHLTLTLSRRTKCIDLPPRGVCGGVGVCEKGLQCERWSSGSG
jgi:hypothetical protein